MHENVNVISRPIEMNVEIDRYAGKGTFTAKNTKSARGEENGVCSILGILRGALGVLAVQYLADYSRRGTMAGMLSLLTSWLNSETSVSITVERVIRWRPILVVRSS